MDNNMNIARMLALMARAFGYSVVGLCQTPWDANRLKVPRPFFIPETQTTMKNINVGQLIHDELTRQERSVVWLARKIMCDRTNVYRIFAKESIDTELLARISNALNHNFFNDIAAAVEDGLSNK